MVPEDVIISPVLTEKTTVLQESGVYVFRVSKRANKIAVKNAIRELFNVHPVACRIQNVKGKPRRVRYVKGYTTGWKKAFVTLREGERIAALENV